MVESAALGVFPLLMVFSALSDLFTMTIPNRVSLLLVAFYLAIAAFLPIPLEIVGWHISSAVGMLLIGFVMFHFGWIGGGDAKLAAATALWLGWDQLLDYGLLASLMGGAITLAIILLRRLPLPPRLLSYDFIARLAEKNGGVPYGIALAAAGLLVYPDTLIWTRLIGA